MSITCITCTSDRPWAIARAEVQMARQTLQPDEWLVADDGLTPATLTQGQEHLRLPPQRLGAASLAHNLGAALRAARGDYVVIMEDDDWYHPEYLAACQRRLSVVAVAGEPWLRYYHVRERRFATLPNGNCSGLYQTALHREYLPALLAAVQRALAQGGYDIDGRFWQALAPGVGRRYDERLTVGIKGMPGKAGLGVGHRPLSAPRRRLRPGSWQVETTPAATPWSADPTGQQLRVWVGADADYYLSYSEVPGG